MVFLQEKKTRVHIRKIHILWSRKHLFTGRFAASSPGKLGIVKIPSWSTSRSLFLQEDIRDPDRWYADMGIHSLLKFVLTMSNVSLTSERTYGRSKPDVTFSWVGN